MTSTQAGIVVVLAIVVAAGMVVIVALGVSEWWKDRKRGRG